MSKDFVIEILEKLLSDIKLTPDEYCSKFELDGDYYSVDRFKVIMCKEELEHILSKLR